MGERRAYAGRKSPVQPLQLIALAGLSAVWVRNCDTNLAAVGAFVCNYFGEIYGLLRQEQERVADDVNLAARSG